MTLTGGTGTDTFFLTGDLADTRIVITDFQNGTGGEGGDILWLGGGRQITADGLDFTSNAYYTEESLAAHNAANGTDHVTPLDWLRADAADGTLDEAEGLNLAFEGGFDPRQLTAANTGVACFAADVLIETGRGPVAAGKLAVGDMVRTRDAACQPLRWVGARHLSTAELAAAPNLRPIRIRAGALGEGTPAADLVVSPQHRVLVRSKIAQRMFGTDEVLVAARQLLRLEGIEVAEDMTSVTYVHFLFDDHQIVFSNGAETESLHTREQALKSVGQAAREEIFAIFPELRVDGARGPARPLIQGKTARKLSERHVRNGRQLVS